MAFARARSVALISKPFTADVLARKVIAALEAELSASDK
jgi:hypothetical protein